MRRLISILTIFICLFSSLLTIAVYSITTYLSSNKQTTSINIDLGVDSEQSQYFDNNREIYYKTIEQVATENNLEIYRYSYDIYQNPINPTTAIYTNAKEDGDFLRGFKLKTGSYINTHDGESTGIFLSTIDTGSADQIGIVSQFNGMNVTEIHPFTGQIDLPLSFSCNVNTNDKEKLDNFMNELNQRGVRTNGIGSIFEGSTSDNVFLVLFVAVIFFCVYVLFVIVIIYYLTNSYKEVAVKKLLGNDNKNIIFRKLMNFVKVIAISELINFIVTTVVLGMYNRFSYYAEFMFIWVLIQLLVVVLSIIIFSIISYILVGQVKVSQMIKNKKPVLMTKILNYIVRLVFSTIIICIIFFMFQNIIYLISTNKNNSRWEETAHFAYIRNVDPASIVDGKLDCSEQYNAATVIKQLFVSTNNDGGVLISPNDTYIYKLSPQDKDISVNYPEYKKDSVSINNNYLKRNPIFDLNNNKVELNDEYVDIITLLVPEKYRDYEKEIREYYNHSLMSSKYDLQILKAKYENSERPVKQDVKIDIIYVKNNQKYFTYNPNYCTETNNEIIDPIAVVLNNTTLSLSDCLCAIARGDYFAITEDMNHPRNSLEEKIKEAEADSIVRIESVYKTIDEKMYEYKMQLILQILVTIISIFILIVITLSLTFSYLEFKKHINAVEKLFGFSFIKRHIEYFLSIIIFWVFIFGLISMGSYIYGVIQFLNLQAIGLIVLFFTLLDLLLSTLIIKLKELKNTKDLLKGE